MEAQTKYQNAIKFAAAKHEAIKQKVPGTELPYVVHLSNVAMEVMFAAMHTPGFDIELAIHAALLHDTIEDTHTSFEEIETLFGKKVAEGVLALTKNDELPKDQKMNDSLQRIKKLSPEIGAV